MKELCCPAMGDAISRQVVDWPITYTQDKEMRRLTPSINGREPGPATLLNYCPWCGSWVNQNQEPLDAPLATAQQDGAPPASGDRCPECGGEIVEERGKWIVTKCGECGEVLSELDYPGADLDEQMVRY